MKKVRARMLGQLANVDPKIAQRVADNIGHSGPIDKVPGKVPVRTNLKPSPALSILAKAKPSLETRMIGCLVADGTDMAVVSSLMAAAKSAGAMVKIIAPKVEGAKASDGRPIAADFQLAGGPSVLFDSVFLALSEAAATQLSTQPAALGFVSDAFSHLKVIGHTPGAAVLVTKAGAMPDEGIVSSDRSPESYLTQAAKGRVWGREPKVRPMA